MLSSLGIIIAPSIGLTLPSCFINLVLPKLANMTYGLCQNLQSPKFNFGMLKVCNPSFFESFFYFIIFVWIYLFYKQEHESEEERLTAEAAEVNAVLGQPSDQERRQLLCSILHNLTMSHDLARIVSSSQGHWACSIPCQGFLPWSPTDLPFSSILNLMTRAQLRAFWRNLSELSRFNKLQHMPSKILSKHASQGESALHTDARNDPSALLAVADQHLEKMWLAEVNVMIIIILLWTIFSIYYLHHF